MHTRHADPHLREDEDPRLWAEERGLRRNPPTSTLIRDFLPQNLEITHPGCSNHPVCTNFLQEAQETDALEDNRFSIKSEDEINHIVGATGKIPKGTEDPSYCVMLFPPSRASDTNQPAARSTGYQPSSKTGTPAYLPIPGPGEGNPAHTFSLIRVDWRKESGNWISPTSTVSALRKVTD